MCVFVTVGVRVVVVVVVGGTSYSSHHHHSRLSCPINTQLYATCSPVARFVVPLFVFSWETFLNGFSRMSGQLALSAYLVSCSQNISW